MQAFPTKRSTLSLAFAIQIASLCQPLLANELFRCEWRSKLEGSTGETLPVGGAHDFSVIPEDRGQFAIRREGLGERYEGRSVDAFYVGRTSYVVDGATYQEFVTINRVSLEVEWITRLGDIEVVYSGLCRVSR